MNSTDLSKENHIPEVEGNIEGRQETVDEVELK